MASVLVVEPHPEVRELLVRIVRRLGHEALVHDGRSPAGREHVDVVILEPAQEGSLEAVEPLVREQRAALVCVSIFPATERTAALAPVAHLQKPFSLAELERALAIALSETLSAA